MNRAGGRGEAAAYRGGMSLREEGYPLAAAVSPRLQVIDHVDSTNARLMRDAHADAEGHPHLSVLLRVGAVEVADRGWIPLIAGAAMRDAIAAQLPGETVALKWPNDVLVGAGPQARKISGILTEVLPSDPLSVVVGAGVNTAMPTFDLPVPTATSFADLKATADEDRLLADFLTGLRDGIADLAVGGHAAVADRVTEHCSTLGAEVAASLPGGAMLHGRAVRLDDTGRLVLVSEGVESVVGAGDVIHVR